MMNFFKTYLRVAGRFALWIGASLVFIIILAQISLWFGLQWLNSSKGEVWAKQKIDIALKDTDYKIDYTGFRYRPLTSINVKNLSLSNSEGEILKAENTKVGVDILSFALRDLSLNFVSDKVLVHRLPAPAENDIEKPKSFYVEEFSLPNLYFNKFNISKIAINNLELAEPIMGRSITLSPLLTGDITMDETSKIKTNLSLQPDVKNISNIAYLPKKIKFDGQFDTRTAIINLKELLITSPLYSVAGEGSATLREDGQIKLKAGVVSKDLSQISSAIDGTFKSEFALNGTQENLALNAKGIAAMPILEQRGLQPIDFSVQTNYQQQNGLRPMALEISSAYKNVPINIMSTIEQNGSEIIVKDIKGVAPEVTVDGAIIYNLDDTIATGKISASINKLSTYKELLRQDIGGKLDITANLSKGAIGQQAAIHANGVNIKYQDIDLKGAKINATFPTIDNYWPSAAEWNLSGLSAQGVNLSAMSGTIKNKAGDIYSLNMKGTGKYNLPFSFDTKADLTGLKVNKPQAQNIKANVKYNNQPFSVSGQVNPKNIDMLIKVNSLSLSKITDALPAEVQKTRLSGQATIKGLMSAPIIDSDLSLSAFSLSKKTPDIKIDMAVGYKDKQSYLKFNGNGKGIKTLSGNVQTPVQLSLNPFVFDLPVNQALNGKAVLNIDVTSLAKIFLPPQNNFSGIFQSNITVAGTAQNPSVISDFKLSNAKFSNEDLGVYLRDLNAQGQLQNDRFTLNSLSANDEKKGTIKASGALGLNNFSPQDVNMKLKIDNFHLLDSELADGVFDADLQLSGDPSRYNVNGSVRPDYIDVTIPEKLTTTIPELNIVETEGDSKIDNMLELVALNIDFIADNKIFVRGWGVDAEFGGRLKIDGNLGDPNFEGVLKSSRGRYTEFGKRFELTRANLNFLGRIPATPVMDIVAETKVDDILAQVNIKGTIQNPKVTFSSDPALPDDEVLARILFGRDLSSISPFQAVQLAQTIRRFSGKGGGGFDPLGEIRDATGIDDLRVDTDEDGETTVGAGKYLTDKVYLEFEKGSGENSGAANLEIEVTPNITIESQVGQDAQAGAGVFWEWDY